MGKPLSKRVIITWVILTAAMIVYMVYMPFLIKYGADKSEYYGWMKSEPEAFTGQITVWHIVSFKPYVGSAGNWLANCAAPIEKKHFGVYFKVEAMSAEDCEARMQNGERADIYSFPAGWCSGEKLRTMNLTQKPAMKSSFVSAGEYDGEQHAIPYLYSVYNLLISSAIASEKSVQLPSDGMSAEFVADTAEKLDFSRKSGRVYGMSGNAVLAALYGVHGDVTQINSFRDSDASMAFADIRFMGDLDRLNKLGKGIEHSSYTVTCYTDLVQYIGIDSETDDSKLSYCNEFISNVLSEKMQRTIPELGVFYTVELPDELVFEQETVQKMYDAAKNVPFANTFALYDNRDEISRLTAEVLKGSDEAKGKLISLFCELVTGFKIE